MVDICVLQIFFQIVGLQFFLNKMLRGKFHTWAPTQDSDLIGCVWAWTSEFLNCFLDVSDVKPGLSTTAWDRRARVSRTGQEGWKREGSFWCIEGGASWLGFNVLCG